MKRRSAIALLSLLGLLPLFSRRKDGEIEAADASAFFAPYLADRLASGTPLSVVRRAGGAYLAYDSATVGRLPAGIGASSARVSRMLLDGHGRTRLFVTLA